MVNDAEAPAVIPTPDLTFCEAGRIHSGYMATTRNGGYSEAPAGVIRAALYARVSDPSQAKEGTIESQVLALKKQIAAANHTLVKEYIDNGFSGPRFDRPALDEMRKDLKTNVFDVVYYSTTEHWDEQRPSGAVASLQKAGALDARANPVDRRRSEVQPQRKR